MSLLSKSDLKYPYSWTAIAPDDPEVTGAPDSALLNRNEGYEVLDFINRFAQECKFKYKASATKAERLIKEHLPNDIRSHENISRWLADNWNRYDKPKR